MSEQSHAPQPAAPAVPKRFSRPIVMVGFTATGKTAVGQEYARRHGLTFVDTDQLIEEKHGPIFDMFRSRGEHAFRQIEARTVASVLEGPGERLLVSVGGGAVLDSGTQQLLADVTVVFLDNDLETVRPRLLRSLGRRPLLSDDPLSKWEQMEVARRPVYERLASIVLDGRGRTIAEVADQLDARFDEAGC